MIQRYLISLASVFLAVALLLNGCRTTESLTQSREEKTINQGVVIE